MQQLEDLEKFDKRLDNYVWNSHAPFRSNGQNKVFLGRQLSTNRTVIVKALPLNQFTDEYILNHLLNDWHKLQSLKSPYLCETFQILLSKSNVYIFEEFYPQGNLKQFIKDHQNSDIYPEKILKFINDLIRGLEFLSLNNTFHGNLKPENLIISDGVLKLNDFTFKRNLYRKNPNHLYQPYEQLQQKNQNLSIKDDVWALGCLIYEMYVGKTPFFGLNELEMMQSLEKDPLLIPESILDKDIAELISQTLQREPQNRWNLPRVASCALIKKLRAGEGIPTKASINDMDYSAKLILIGLSDTIKKYKIDIEALFQKFDISGDKIIELNEFQSMLRVLDPKLSNDQIEHVFMLIDNDGSGSISLEELKELMGLKLRKAINEFAEDKEMEAKIKKMMYILRETISRNSLNINMIFSRYDNSGDMSLDLVEFSNLLKDIYPSIEEGVAEYLFRKLDYDGSGDLGLNEFKSYVMEDKELEKKLKEFEEKTQETVILLQKLLYGQKYDLRKLFAKADSKKRGKINEEEFRELILLIKDQIPRDIIRNMFKKIDKDGSGFIEYEEFSNYLK